MHVHGLVSSSHVKKRVGIYESGVCPTLIKLTGLSMYIKLVSYFTYCQLAWRWNLIWAYIYDSLFNTQLIENLKVKPSNAKSGMEMRRSIGKIFYLLNLILKELHGLFDLHKIMHWQNIYIFNFMYCSIHSIWSDLGFIFVIF